MKITNVRPSSNVFSPDEAATAMLACGFAPSSLESMEILAAYDPRAGVTEVIVFADVGIYGGNDCDGWNTSNSLRELGGETAEDIDAQYGDGASMLPIWKAYLAATA